jgi:hypothetical protein
MLILRILLLGVSQKHDVVGYGGVLKGGLHHRPSHCRVGYRDSKSPRRRFKALPKARPTASLQRRRRSVPNRRTPNRYVEYNRIRDRGGLSRGVARLDQELSESGQIVHTATSEPYGGLRQGTHPPVTRLVRVL